MPGVGAKELPVVHLFIDTNTLLSFFAFTKDDLEELKKLVSLIKNGQIRLYLTKHLFLEFFRNRDVKLAASIAEFRTNTKFSDGVRRFMAALPGYSDYRDAAQKYEIA